MIFPMIFAVVTIRVIPRQLRHCAKQNRESTEGYSGENSRKDTARSGKLVTTIGALASPKKSPKTFLGTLTISPLFKSSGTLSSLHISHNILCILSTEFLYQLFKTMMCCSRSFPTLPVSDGIPNFIFRRLISLCQVSPCVS